MSTQHLGGGDSGSDSICELTEGAGLMEKVQDQVRIQEGSLVSDDDDTGIEGLGPVKCVHLRGGWCVVHKLQGRKSAKLFTTWEKLKSGLYGWKVRSKVEYCCKLELKPDAISVRPGSSAIFPSKAESGRGSVTGGITISGISGARKPSQPESVTMG